MDSNKRGTTSNNLTCNVCKIDFNSNADYALHEFSKKHCDNLIRLAKQKPVVSKQKTKHESSQVEKETSKVNAVTHTGSFAKYGYFVPGEIYASAEVSKEFNTDYDPYAQKFAKNPFKEKPILPTHPEPSTFCSVTSFSKKKKKKIKTCQVCNITLSTVPEYEAHMKSPHHIWKLKVTGMGVSAHFVKASTDLHTTDIIEEPKPDQVKEQTLVTTTTTTSNENPSSGPFPLLYCNDCELLLNSPQQYNAHINGKSHIECAQKKIELKAKREKLENPSPNQLYCYSCKILLNNLFQYNEHKNGKKHKAKCKNLIKKGITIPPEERVPGIPLTNLKKPVIYPELYEKFVLEKQKQKEGGNEHSIAVQDNTGKHHSNSTTELTSFGLNYHSKNDLDSQETYQLAENENIHTHDSNGSHNENHSTITTLENHSESFIEPKIIFHKTFATPQTEESFSNSGMPEVTEQIGISKPEDLSIKTNEEPESQVKIITDEPVKCSICSENFQWQWQFDAHLSTEDHLKKILELKQNGRTDNEILNAIFVDRTVVKPNNLGKLTCSICNVTADNDVEFHQHLSSIVHKYTQKDYKMKKTLEVKRMIASNEQGLFFCKLCKEGWPSLTDYIQHLHFMKHKSIQRVQRSKVVLAKRTSYAQKQRFMLSVRKKQSSLRRIKIEKNPGVRTKVCGVAVDLQSGTQASIPNLEPLEPKIDMTKNVIIGVCEKITNDTIINNESVTDNDNLTVSKLKKRRKVVRAKQPSNGPYHNTPPFLPSGNIPPLMPGPSFQSSFPRHGYVPTSRNWGPYSSPYSPVFEPFCGRPPMGHPYHRPPWFQRPPWPRYR